MTKQILFAGILCLVLAGTAQVFAHEMPAHKAATAAQASPVATLPHAAQEHDVHAESVADDDDGMVMLHPGLPETWLAVAAMAMFSIAIWSLMAPVPRATTERAIDLAAVPVAGGVVGFLIRGPYPLLAGKVLSVVIFLLVLAAGFFGTAYPERNFATAFVWNLWWPLLVVSVLFVGTAWCAICPWDALANWLVRRRWWRRADPHPGLNLRVPRYLHNSWLALLMFLLLTWLEIGFGVTTLPAATATMALMMLVLSVVFLLLFERKAFCRYACPVGRTLGYYARLAPVAVRPVAQATCDACTSLDCYNGSREIEPCPTHLVVGRFSENTFCLSCGNCVQSCAQQNVSWWLRSPGSEAQSLARPQWDGAWFMLALLGITTFHGLTMMPFWADWAGAASNAVGASGRPLFGFTLGMIGSLVLPVLIYGACVGVLHRVAGKAGAPYKTQFAAFSFAALPLAFTYHLAHNLDHLSRESSDVFSLLSNPLGNDAVRRTMAEIHGQMMAPLLPDDVMFALQAALMVFGFWLAVQILRHRGRDERLVGSGGLRGWRLLPMLAFVAAIAAINLWLMAQDMEMRF